MGECNKGEDDDDDEVPQTYYTLLMMKEAFEPQKLREVCYELGSLTQFEKCVIIMEEYHAHHLVLEMMDSLHLHPDIQLAGLSTLNAMMRASPKLLALIEKKNIISVIKDLLLQYENDPQMHSTVFQTVSVLACSDKSRPLLLNERMVDIILENMQDEKFKSDGSLQSSACRAIRYLLIGDDNLQIEFVEQDHHKVFIDLLTTHRDIPLVLEEAILLLTILASQEEKYDFILQASQYTIPDIMNAYPDSASMQTAACIFLKNLARTVDDQQLLVVKGIYPLVIHVLRKFQSDVEAQVAALEVLDKIAGAVITSHQWLGYKINDDCWLKEAFYAMIYHPGSVQCQVLACKVLCYLLESQPAILDVIGDDDSPLLAVDNAVLTGLRLYGDTELSVFVASARAIYHLAVNSKDLQDHLVMKGAHLDIKNGMHTFWDYSEAQGAACQAITGLCLASLENKSKFAQMELHIQIFASLKKFSTVRPFLDEAVRCITCLADVGVVRNQSMVEGIHEVFLQAMVDNQEDQEFQELSLEAMSVLSSAEGMVDILCEAGLLNNTVKIMEQFDQCENIQQKGSILFQTLVTHQKAPIDIHLSKQVATAIITSMTKFKTDANVLAESCVALQLLADKSDEVSRVLVDCEVHSVLFMLLEQFDSNDVLVDLACEVLYILCCRWDFKNEMMIWACKNSLNRGVEVLLQLGADVNTGSGRESPLCYACQNDNEKMVVLILEQNVTDMQTALSFCLELELHHLAGIILTYIGYEQEMGNVIWSNLSLNDLHARWFIPTFAKESARVSITSTHNISSVDSSLASRILSKEAKREKRNKMRHLLSEEKRRRSSISLVIEPSFNNPGKSNDAKNVITEGTPSTELQPLPQRRYSDNLSVTEVDSSRYLRSSRLTKDKRSFSVSEGDAVGRRRLRSLDSTSGIRRPLDLLPLRKPSISSAELPVNVDDPRWLDSFQGGNKSASLSLYGLKSFHGSTPDTSSMGFSQTTNFIGFNSLSPISDNQQSQVDGPDYTLDTPGDSTSPMLQSPIYPASGVDASESSAMEDYTSDVPMPDLLPKDVFASTPLRSNFSRPSRSSKHRLSSSSTAGSTDWCPSVTYLNLSSNGIPSLDALVADRYLLSQFKTISKLDLSKNNLKDIPAEFFQALQDLDNIDVSGNELITFPADIFSHCSKLQTLTVADNEIFGLPKVPEDSCKSLHVLDLSINEIGACPMWFSEYTPNLRVLELQSTNISSLPEQSLALLSLKTLNISHNSIPALPSQFLEDCLSLETLNLSHNKLENLPVHIPQALSKLNVMKLGNNKLGPDIPGFVLGLPSLKNIDLSSNALTTIAAPYQWKSSLLREINVSHNRIKELSLDKKFDLRNWQKLEKLLLSHNKISKIPKELGKLTDLSRLDISYNKEINTIPDELGTLSKLWEFSLDGLKLDLDPAIRKSTTKAIIGFLNQKLKKAVPYFRMKLMVVGYGGRGKSSLLARLRKDKPGKKKVSTATVGIDVGELKIPVMYNRRSEMFHLTTWDIAGQEDFYSTHPCFLSGRALFLVVYDLNRGTEEVKTIRNWLLTIQALAPFSPIIIIGTHKDKIPKESLSDRIHTIREKIKTLCLAPGFPTVERFAEVSCLHDDGDMDKLRKMIQEAIERAKIKGQPIVGQKIPHSYKLLEELFQEEAVRLKESDRNPIMVQSEVLMKVREKEITLSEEELVQAARFLHETGVILHYDDPTLHLEHLYFVQPEWLCKIMAQVITVREINPFVNPEGVMRKSDIYQLIKSTVDQSSHFVRTYINLLEKFEVALPLSEMELLIPSKVPCVKPHIKLPPARELLHRYYWMPYTPVGLWPRLILRLLQFSTDMLRGEESFNSFERTSKYWREGIYVYWSQEVFFVVESLKSKEAEAIAIVVPTTSLGYRVFGQVCDHLDDLIEEWFPGLNEIDPMMGTTLLQRYVPCVRCAVSGSGTNGHHFLFDDLLRQVEISDTIRCSFHGYEVPIKQLAPDITFADLDDSYHIDEKQLLISGKDVLGEGSFGSVYEASYMGKRVAVKTFDKRSDFHPHRMMRQEVTVLRHLQHPCLVSMEGVSFNPRRLVMELAPLRSLRYLLDSDKGQLNRKLQHKIAMQICEGLEFLHENRIVYRDLKPDNVLIFSLSLKAPQNVKISDYGISRFTTPYGLKASEGTPGYRAPEVIKGTSTYNTEVDMFSYGILLFELVTEGHKPFQDLDFRTEIEEAVVKGRGIPQITECGVAAWPDMQDLINHCTETVPQQRPTAAMALQRLQSADFLCLKQTYPVGSINAESMTVRKYRKSKDIIHEVWMTGGEGSSTMVSLINPFTSSAKALVQGTMLKEGRGVCILAAGEDLVVVGTQDGSLCVIEPSKESSPTILLKHCFTLPDTILCLLYQARNDSEGRVLVGLANGMFLFYDVYTLRTDPNGKPVKSLKLDLHSPAPISCMVQHNTKLYVGCGSHVAVLNADSLEVESRLIKNHETDKREPGQVRLIAVDKSVWICRRSNENGHFIEVWDPGKETFKTQLDIASLLREYDPGLTAKECDIKTMLLQPKMALWVGVAGGHLALIDRHTSKLITLVYRYTEALRTITIVKSSESNNPMGDVVVTAGKGFLKRPGSTECTVDENCVHVLVWDAQLKNQVKYVQSEIDRRSHGGHASWQKVQRAIRVVNAFRKSR